VQGEGGEVQGEGGEVNGKGGEVNGEEGEVNGEEGAVQGEGGEVNDEDNIVLNVLAYSETEDNNNYVGSVNDFNEYAKKNNINIRLNINVHANQDSFEAFANSVEALLKKRLNKYDLYYFDNGYTVRYGQYLLDLNEYTKDIIGMHDQKIVDFTCKYDDKLVGIVN